MSNEILQEVRYLQKMLDERADEVSSQMRIPRVQARRRIRQAWSDGCILCKQPGPKEIRRYKSRLYVLCSSCYLEHLIDRGEKELNRSIARRLSRPIRQRDQRH